MFMLNKIKTITTKISQIPRERQNALMPVTVKFSLPFQGKKTRLGNEVIENYA